MIIAAGSKDAVKAAFADQLMPYSPDAWTGLTHRVLRTPWVDHWNAHPTEAAERASELSKELYEGLHGGRVHEFLPFAGQDVGLIDEVVPAGVLVRALAAHAMAVLERDDSLGPSSGSS